jgi:hypothetical protein
MTTAEKRQEAAATFHRDVEKLIQAGLVKAYLRSPGERMDWLVRTELLVNEATKVVEELTDASRSDSGESSAERNERWTRVRAKARDIFVELAAHVQGAAREAGLEDDLAF